MGGPVGAVTTAGGVLQPASTTTTSRFTSPQTMKTASSMGSRNAGGTRLPRIWWRYCSAAGTPSSRYGRPPRVPRYRPGPEYRRTGLTAWGPTQRYSEAGSRNDVMLLLLAANTRCGCCNRRGRNTLCIMIRRNGCVSRCCITMSLINVICSHT